MTNPSTGSDQAHTQSVTVPLTATTRAGWCAIARLIVRDQEVRVENVNQVFDATSETPSDSPTIGRAGWYFHTAARPR